MTTNEQRLINNVIAVLKEKQQEFTAFWYADMLNDSIKYKNICITKDGVIIQPIQITPEGEDIETIVTLVGEIIERDRLVYIDKQNAILESYLGEVKVQDKGKTDVLFLMEKVEEGETAGVIAYLPNETYNTDPNLKSGYAHVGQHTAIHTEYANECTKATPEQYNDLKLELESIGYNLNVLN